MSQLLRFHAAIRRIQVRVGAETQGINAPETAMTSPPRTSLLRRLIGAPAEAPQQDPADMGTAIGMDYVMDQPPLAEPLRPRVPQDASRRSWLPRRRP